ncbi:31063_t:CDS:2, partial [Gigaspora margarita]
PLYIPPARKKDLDGPVLKIIQYKYEFNLDWYLLTFKDSRRQPEWQQYRNLEGCNDMIKDFWIREEAGTTPMVGPFGSSKFLRFSKRKIKKSNYSPKLNENDKDIVYLKDPNRSMHNSPLTQIQ